jgi:hypothetical protein
MASPAAVRQPLSQRSINTQSFYPSSNNLTATTSTTITPSTYKPLVGQKRTHSQSTGQENVNTNVQQQILGSAAAFKQPSLPRHPHYALQAAGAQKSRTTDVRTRPIVQIQPQFKQPLPRTGTLARQRQQTNNPAVTGEEGDKEEVIEWRRQMKRTLSVSTFYFDGIEESFKETATRIILRQGGVQPSQSKQLTGGLESRAILFEFGQHYYYHKRTSPSANICSKLGFCKQTNQIKNRIIQGEFKSH